MAPIKLEHIHGRSCNTKKQLLSRETAIAGCRAVPKLTLQVRLAKKRHRRQQRKKTVAEQEKVFLSEACRVALPHHYPLQGLLFAGGARYCKLPTRMNSGAVGSGNAAKCSRAQNATLRALFACGWKNVASRRAYAMIVPSITPLIHYTCIVCCSCNCVACCCSPYTREVETGMRKR